MPLARSLMAVAVAACLAFPSPGRANDDLATRRAIEDLQAGLYVLCQNHGTIAAAIMSSRQKDVPKPVVMSMVNRSLDGSALYLTAREMVDSAYEGARYETPTFIADAIARFRDRWTARCYERWTPVVEGMTGAASGSGEGGVDGAE